MEAAVLVMGVEKPLCSVISTLKRSSSWFDRRPKQIEVCDAVFGIFPFQCSMEWAEFLLLSNVHPLTVMLISRLNVVLRRFRNVMPLKKSRQRQSFNEFTNRSPESGRRGRVHNFNGEVIHEARCALKLGKETLPSIIKAAFSLKGPTRCFY